VRTLDTLRRAGRAGGVEDRKRVTRPGRIRFDWFPRNGHQLDRTAEELAPHLLVKAPDTLQRLELRVDRAQMLELRRLSDQDARVGVPEHVPQLRPPARRVDRHERRAQPAAREENIQQLHTIAGDAKHAVAPADPGRLQRPGHTRNRDLHLGIRPLPADVPQQRLPTPAGSTTRKHPLNRPHLDPEWLGEALGGTVTRSHPVTIMVVYAPAGTRFRHRTLTSSR